MYSDEDQKLEILELITDYYNQKYGIPPPWKTNSFPLSGLRGALPQCTIINPFNDYEYFKDTSPNCYLYKLVEQKEKALLKSYDTLLKEQEKLDQKLLKQQNEAETKLRTYIRQYNYFEELITKKLDNLDKVKKESKSNIARELRKQLRTTKLSKDEKQERQNEMRRIIAHSPDIYAVMQAKIQQIDEEIEQLMDQAAIVKTNIDLVTAELETINILIRLIEYQIEISKKKKKKK